MLSLLKFVGVYAFHFTQSIHRSYGNLTVTFIALHPGFCVINGCQTNFSPCVKSVDELKNFSSIGFNRVKGLQRGGLTICERAN